LPIAIITITGMALSLNDLWVHSEPPYKLENEVHSDSNSVGLLLSKIAIQHPDLEIKSVSLPKDSKHSLRSVWTRLNHLSQTQSPVPSIQEQVYFLNPESGDIISDRDPLSSQGFSWILKIHRGTITGVTGKVFISILGALLFLLWPTGLLISFTKKKFQPISFHGPAGFLAGAVISFMGLSGSLMNFNKNLIQAMDPVPPTKISTKMSTPLLAALDKALSHALIAHSGSGLQSIHFPQVPETSILFYFNDNSRVYLDFSTGKIIKIMSKQTNWIHSLYPLHSGRIFGSFQAIFSGAVGMLLLGLIATGFRRKKVINSN
jgi:uncharacterized iron-regulated membrane protein